MASGLWHLGLGVPGKSMNLLKLLLPVTGDGGEVSGLTFVIVG